MAIKGKKKYMIYLNEENAEYVKSFLETTRNKGGLSGIMDAHLKTMTLTLKASNYKKGQKVGFMKLLKIAKNGLMREPS